MNENEYRKAHIFVQDIYAGLLEENDKGYSFTYDRDYLDSSDPLPVSLTLPLRQETYQSEFFFPFFDGLIPEGWLLNLVSDNWKIDPRDRFGLLLVACRDCIGDVEVKAV
ncbi:MAG: HipA N-terminal domain-containing protein [Lachnospiraceae bacterium]|nr:HipA N-terminal domain-containing protein [Lachnospiraceae bacterium]